MIKCGSNIGNDIPIRKSISYFNWLSHFQLTWLQLISFTIRTHFCILNLVSTLFINLSSCSVHKLFQFLFQWINQFKLNKKSFINPLLCWLSR